MSGSRKVRSVQQDDWNNENNSFRTELRRKHEILKKILMNKNISMDPNVTLGSQQNQTISIPILILDITDGINKNKNISMDPNVTLGSLQNQTISIPILFVDSMDGINKKPDYEYQDYGSMCDDQLGDCQYSAENESMEALYETSTEPGETTEFVEETTTGAGETTEFFQQTSTEPGETTEFVEEEPNYGNQDYGSMCDEQYGDCQYSAEKETMEGFHEVMEEFQEDIIDDIDNLLENSTAISIESVQETLDKVDSLLESDTNVTGELLLRLDQLGPMVDLEGSRTLTVARDNIAIVVADGTPSNPVRGVRVTTQRNDAFNDDCFNFITDEDYSSYLSSNESDVVVALPLSTMDTSHRISFVVFRDERPFAFNPGSRAWTVNSRVLSAVVSNVTHFGNNEVISIYFRPTIAEPGRNWRRACAYWHFAENGTGFWSEDGCIFIRSTNPEILDACQCDHLTHFAEVLIPVTRFSEQNERILEILSGVGCSLSVIGLILVAVTAATFKSWRKDFSNRIWLQLCIAILILNICFLTVTFVRFDHKIWCILVGVLLHYSVLVSFFWMFVAAVISYRSLVVIFSKDVSRKLLKSSLFAWGTPFVIIGILLAVNHNAYLKKFDDTAPTGAFCYPSGISLWVTIFIPIAVILLTNWILFLAILRSLWSSSNIRTHGGSKDSLRSAVVSSLLVFMFGLPWIFGLFAYNIVAAYIFTITVSLQGFVLFIFFILANKRTRALWIKKIKREPTSITPNTWNESDNSRRQNSTSPNLPASVEMTTMRRILPESSSLLRQARVKVLPPFERPDYYYE